MTLGKYASVNTSHQLIIVALNFSSYYKYTTQWLEATDRGGLFHVNDSTFLFFRALEVQTQRLLPQHLAKSKDSKEALVKAVINDEDVGFTWDMLSTDIRSQDHAQELLESIVSHWITIRGFAQTASWLEEYKIASSKKTKKTKSLRKELKKSEESKKT